MGADSLRLGFSLKPACLAELQTVNQIAESSMLQEIYQVQLISSPPFITYLSCSSRTTITASVKSQSATPHLWARGMCYHRPDIGRTLYLTDGNVVRYPQCS